MASGVGGCDASDASEGCNEYETGLGSSTTTPFTLSASTPWVDVAMSFAPLTANTYYAYMWYATAGSSGADTVSASFSQSVAGSVSIYEISGVTAAGLLSSTGRLDCEPGGDRRDLDDPFRGLRCAGGNRDDLDHFHGRIGIYSLRLCGSVAGCGEYQTGVGSATTVPDVNQPDIPVGRGRASVRPV